MLNKSLGFARMIGCCNCFGFTSKPKRVLRPTSVYTNRLSEQLLGVGDLEEDDESYNGDAASSCPGDETESQFPAKRSEEILEFRAQNGLICRQYPVKETLKVVRSEDEHGYKMINEYVRECKINSGSYAKVVLYRSSIDGKHYAIKAFHKSHLLKRRVSPTESAMTDVLREVQIMKMLEHPNIVNLVEVINDPDSDNFYMVLEYVEGKWLFEGTGPPGGLEESRAKMYLRDIISGLMYLHAHNVVHGDIKPENLLVTRNGNVKIADFSVSQVFEDEEDELRRSPGTPAFTAPECCLGLTYHGKAADTWAVGVTLCCMVLGQYPFIEEKSKDTHDDEVSDLSVYHWDAATDLVHPYDKIVNNPLVLPDDMNPHLKNLLEGLLCKDPKQRMTLESVAEHAWIAGDDGPIPQYACFCKRKSFQEESKSNTLA